MIRMRIWFCIWGSEKYFQDCSFERKIKIKEYYKEKEEVLKMEKKKRKKWPIVCVIVVLIAAVALLFAYQFDLLPFGGDKEDEKTEQNEAVNTQTSSDNASSQTKSDSSDSQEASDTEGKPGSDEMAAMMAMMSAAANIDPVTDLALPRSENELSLELALQALTLCSGGNKTNQAKLMLESGFELLLQYGFDKAEKDISHTCAFSVGRKTVDFYGEPRTLLLVAIRGTSGAEWFSNFNYMDSHSDESEFAENFLEAAQVINIQLIPIIKENPDALMLVCGHSRGAAAANLLGMTLDDIYGSEGKYIYTFATPNTYRAEARNTGYNNIYNFINPADVVTEVPLKAMNFHHIGTDIVLPADSETIQKVAVAMNDLYSVSQTISDYYNVRYSISKSGEGEDGYTPYEVMQALASSMTGIRSKVNGELNLTDIYAKMAETAGSENSSLNPILNQVSKIIGRDGQFGMSIFMQHMPMTYKALIEAYSQMMAAMPGGFEMPEGFTGEGFEMPEGFTGEGFDMPDLSEETNAEGNN